MESAALIVLTIGALYYIYKKTFVNNGCNCGKDDCPTKNIKKNDE